MVINSLISITIPTYNRADFLDRFFEIHIPLAKEHNVQIFVFDNSSTDRTRLIVEKRMLEYPLIRYSCNKENIGPDKNFELALKKPQTDYIWLMGDTHRIPHDGIQYFIKKLSDKKKYDALIINSSERVSDIENREYTNKNELLSDLGWHMTCMSCLIYNKDLIDNADFERYYNTNFIQTGIIFEYINSRPFTIPWRKDLSIRNVTIEGVKKISWQDRTFEIWAGKWTDFILSLPPAYELNVKLKCIKDHGVKSGLFSFKMLFLLRSNNMFNIRIYKRYSNYFSISICHSKFTMLAISLFPIFILNGMKILFKKIMKKNNNFL